MKAHIEKGSDYSRFVVGGTFPKLSIDYRIEMLDSHSKEPSPDNLGFCRQRDPLSYVAYADNERNGDLALSAAQRIFKALRPAFPYLEVIKISFYWNKNLTLKPNIVAGIVIIDPATNKKEWVKVMMPVWGFDSPIHGEPDKSVVDETNETTLTDLVRNLIVATRKQIDAFSAEHAAVAVAAQHFESLFLPV